MSSFVPDDNFDRELICSYLKVSKDSIYLSRSKVDGSSPFVLKGPLYKNYVPVIDIITEEHINTKNLRFCYRDNNGRNVSNDVTTYDRFRGQHRYRQEVIESKFIDVSESEIFLGAVDIVLNLTNNPVIMQKRNSIEHIFIPIVNSRLNEVYGGRLHIMEFYYLSNPEVISKLYPHASHKQNYLEIKAEQCKDVDKSSYRIYSDALKFWEYMHSNLGNIDTSNFTNLDELVNKAPIVLVYSTIVTESMFEAAKKKAGNDSIAGIYIPHKDSIVTLADIYENKNNLFPKDSTLESLTKHIEHNVYLFEIVDTESKISDRYVTIYHEPVLIPKVKDKSRENGLYVYKLNKNFEKILYHRYDLDKIDELGFVFKSAEEAKERLNSEKIFQTRMKQMEENSRKRDAEHQAKMKQMEEDSRKRDAEHQKEILEHQKRILELQSQVQLYRSRIEMESYNRRLNYEERKYEYEERKYQRDETLETIKLVAALAGVVSTGILLYSKMTK